MKRLDPVIHEPARLLALNLLAGHDRLDFYQLLELSEMTAGNLSSHMARLEAAGYVTIRKTFRDRTPHTTYRITDEGREALRAYWRDMDNIRALSRRTG